MPRAVQISDSEWEVMEPIWKAGVCTAAEVIGQLRGKHDWNHSTIRTLLARLVEKRALDYQVDGSRYLYRPVVTRQQCVRREGRAFLDKIFRGDVGALLTHFVSDGSLDQKQLDQLRQLLAQKTQPKEKRR